MNLEMIVGVLASPMRECERKAEPKGEYKGLKKYKDDLVRLTLLKSLLARVRKK